jgi:hypothetical protein
MNQLRPTCMLTCIYEYTHAHVHTYATEPPRYLAWMMQRVRSLGGTISQQKVSSLLEASRVKVPRYSMHTQPALACWASSRCPGIPCTHSLHWHVGHRQGAPVFHAQSLQYLWFCFVVLVTSMQLSLLSCCACSFFVCVGV